MIVMFIVYEQKKKKTQNTATDTARKLVKKTMRVYGRRRRHRHNGREIENIVMGCQRNLLTPNL